MNPNRKHQGKGRYGVIRGEVSPREGSIPPGEVRSSSHLGEAGEELSSRLLLWVEERVEMRVGRSGLSSELQIELIAQSVSLSGEKLQSLRPLRRRVPGRPEREPRVAAEVEGWSGSISGVGDRRYSGLRKSEAL